MIMQSANLSIAVLAFEQLTAEEKQEFMDPRVMWAGTGAIRDENTMRL